MASLGHLPNEVMTLLMTELLESATHRGYICRGLLSLRQTCRRFCHCATPVAFKTLHVMIEKKSIEGLIEISKCPHLAPHVRDLQIHTLHLLPFEELEPMVPRDIRKETRYRKRYEWQQELMTSEHAHKSLYGAISRFKSCKNVAFDGSEPPFSPSRRKSSLIFQYEWSSTKSNASTEFIYDLMLGFFTIAATSEIQIEHLTIDIGYMNDLAYCLKLSQFPRLTKPITSLRHIRLAVDITFKKNRLNQFLNAFPELMDFELEGHRGPYCKRIAGALSGLHIPKLRKLTLNTVSCTVVELEKLVIDHKETLTDIDLIYVRLSDGPFWRRICRMIRDNLAITSFVMSDCGNVDFLEPKNVAELISIADGTERD